MSPDTGIGFKPTRIVEAPILPTELEPFTHTVAPLYSRSTILVLTASGVTVLPSGYDTAVTSPNISRVVSAADGVSSVAPGGLFTIYGTNLNPTNVATKEIPLPTALGDSCLTVNGQPVPILFVSPTQVNGQMPYQAVGNVNDDRPHTGRRQRQLQHDRSAELAFGVPRGSGPGRSLPDGRPCNQQSDRHRYQPGPSR
ncbi:MAG: IPT/TIG domain-containing protein [Acidobacteriota bacterium]